MTIPGLGADSTVIQGELAGLLKVGLPPIIRYLRSQTFNSQVDTVHKELVEGAQMLAGLWNLIPDERKRNIEDKFMNISSIHHEMRKMNFIKALRKKTRKQLKELKDGADEFWNLAQTSSREALFLKGKEPPVAIQQFDQACANVGVDGEQVVRAFQRAEACASLHYYGPVYNNGPVTYYIYGPGSANSIPPLVTSIAQSPSDADSPPESITVPSPEPTPEQIDTVAETFANALECIGNMDPIWEDCSA